MTAAVGGTRLTAIEGELLRVVTRLWFDIDHHGGAHATRYFTPDAHLRFADARFQGHEEIADVYAARSARGIRTSRHLVTNLHLTDAGTDTARAVSSLLLFAQDGPAPRPSTAVALVADVVDEYALVEGEWLISSRWLQNQFIEPATELAVPQADRGERS